MALPSCSSFSLHARSSCNMAKRDLKKMMESLKQSRDEDDAHPVAKRPAAAAGGTMKKPAAAGFGSKLLKRPAAAVDPTGPPAVGGPETQIVAYGETRARNKSTWFDAHKNEMSEDVMASFNSLTNVTAKTHFINNVVVEVPGTGEKYWQLDNPKIQEHPPPSNHRTLLYFALLYFTLLYFTLLDLTLLDFT